MTNLLTNTKSIFISAALYLFDKKKNKLTFKMIFGLGMATVGAVFITSHSFWNNLKCNKCNMTYQEFLDSGKFGCEECYKTFENKIDILLKRIQGTDRYIGKKAEHNESNSVQETKTDNKLEKLQQDLKKAIKEERYEDAAKIRDEIKKIK